MCRPPDNNDRLPDRFVLVTNSEPTTRNSQLTTRALRPHNSQPSTSVRISLFHTYALYHLFCQRFFTEQTSVQPA